VPVDGPLFPLCLGERARGVGQHAFLPGSLLPL
jgi:hypothetical protein